ncbi:MAG: VOC family protein [Candidatus Levybacteria bacterium]|nr:VOC family protein [Candidatus Levybacteria bacterium]
MLDLNSIMIGTSQVEVMGKFYEKILGRPADMTDGGWYGWQIGKGFLTIGEHSEVKGKAKEPQRLIMNFETTEVKKEFERMKKAGATVIKEPYGMDDSFIATLADPDGNYFQLMTPWEPDNTKN